MHLTCAYVILTRCWAPFLHLGHKVGMSLVKPRQSCCILKLYAIINILKKTWFPIYSLLWKSFKDFFWWECVYIDLFTYSHVKICINIYMYSHPYILLYTALSQKRFETYGWDIHTELISLPDTTSFDHRPVTKFSRIRTRFSKEVWHVAIP